MKTVAFHNLGCKVNSYELDIMQQILVDRGYIVVPFDKKADIYVVNTCTVTNIADRKSRQMLHRAKQKNPDAVVVAVGCYVQTDLPGVEKDPCIDLAIGNNRKKDIGEILEQFLAQREAENPAGGAENPAGGAGNPADGAENPANGAENPAGGAENPANRAEKPANRAENPAGGAKQPGNGGAAEDGNAAPDKTLGGSTVLDIGHTYEYEEMTLTSTAEHTRAYIKIQDGCNQFCSYCAIPLARGRVRSREPEDILREIRGMVQAGYKEVVLTGIHISSYGIDFGARRPANSIKMENGAETADDSPKAEDAAGSSAADNSQVDYRGESRLMNLIERIHEVEGLERIRISSLEPRVINQETAARLAALPKICPHFHLSLQSGCDETLKRMNRHYTAEQFAQSVQMLRQAYFPVIPAITTDVIVGFPGETEEEFQKSKSFLETIHFFEMHIFKYSKRAGTRAAKMPDQVPEQKKAQRSDILLELERQHSHAFREKYLGKPAEVLFEEEKEINGRCYLLGHTPDYVRVAVELTGSAADGLSTDFRTEASGDAVGQDSLKMRLAPNKIASVMVREFLTEDILLANEDYLF